MCCFRARTDDGRSVVVYVFIVGPESCGIEERLVVASGVSSLRPNKADEVVDRSRFVIRDLKEERSDGLSKSREVGVGRLSVDGIEVVDGVSKFSPQSTQESCCNSKDGGAVVLRVQRRQCQKLRKA